MSELPDEQAITRDSWTVLRNTDPAHVWICKLLLYQPWHVVVFPGAAARRRLLTRFERPHVQGIPERSFETRSSIARNVSPAARAALALRCMPGMVLQPAASHSTDALRRRLAPLKSSHHLVAFQNLMLPCANNAFAPIKPTSTGLADCRKGC